MNTLCSRRILGFTVIELMIVVALVAILAALAYPSYAEYARKAKRGEAQQQLMNWAINQEIWRSNNPSYNAVTPCGGAGAIIPCNTENFTFTVEAGPNTYTLGAAAIGDQAKDKAKNGDYCGGNGTLMTLNQSGVKAPAACWE